MLNKIFKAVSNGEIIKVIEFDDKSKQCIVEFENGKTRAYSSVTLKDKRRFIPIESDEEQIAEIMKQKEELGIEVPKITEEPKLVPMPGIEKLEELKNEFSGRKPRITITFNGETKTPGEFAEQFNMDSKYIRAQLRKGKTPEEIFGGR